jgi:hypothetical protein
LSYGSKTSDMTSEGLGEMFEGDSADTCAAHVDGGPSGMSGSEDNHQRELILLFVVLISLYTILQTSVSSHSPNQHPTRSILLEMFGDEPVGGKITNA